MHAIVTTLNFMNLFVGVKPDASVSKLINKWLDKDNRPKYSKACPEGDEVRT